MTNSKECKVTKVNDSTYLLRISKTLSFAISSDEAKQLHESFNEVFDNG